MFKKMMLSIFLLGALNAFSHEGHDSTLGSLKANHGGNVKVGKEINLEFVVLGNELKLYPASHEGIDLSTTEVKLTGTSKLPKGKSENLKIEIKNGAYIATIDFKTAYRIEVIVIAEFKGKKDTFKFQVEK